jgi:hypothetical protein
MNIVGIIETITVLGVIIAFGIVSMLKWIKYLEDEQDLAKEEWKSGELVDGTWTCKECGAFNALYLKTCGKCNKKKYEK